MNGIVLSALDLVGGKLLEINLTSPGLLVDSNRIHSKHFEREIYDYLECKLYDENNLHGNPLQMYLKSEENLNRLC